MYCKNCNVIVCYQYGFRKMRSSEDTLARLECNIRQALRKSHIEKTYDKAWMYHILQKVYQCKIRGSLGNFMLNYFCN